MSQFWPFYSFLMISISLLIFLFYSCTFLLTLFSGLSLFLHLIKLVKNDYFQLFIKQVTANPFFGFGYKSFISFIWWHHICLTLVPVHLKEQTLLLALQTVFTRWRSATVESPADGMTSGSQLNWIGAVPWDCYWFCSGVHSSHIVIQRFRQT